jgi:hypothetical protein
VIPHRVFIAIVLLVSAGCQRDEPQPRAPAAASPPPSPAPLAQDTGFAGTTAPLSRVRARPPGAPYEVLRRVETAAAAAATSGAGYDRVVFEFTGDSVPGYSIQYRAGPVQSCGSGDPVPVAGTQRLVVRFEPARAHDEQGNAAPAALIERQLAPRLPTVKEMKLVCDFEGQVEWVLGLAGRAPYRVSELVGPARLVLDVRHQP